MSRGQVPVTKWDQDVGHALGGVDGQLVADVRDVWGKVPAYVDVMDAGRRWGTDATGVLLLLLEDSYPPPPEGWGLTTHTNTAPSRGRRTTRRTP